MAKNYKSIKTINIKTDAEKPLIFDLVAEDIVSISNAIKTLRNSKLSDKAIVMLISESAVVSRTTVKEVLDAIENLPVKYLRK